MENRFLGESRGVRVVRNETGNFEDVFISSVVLATTHLPMDDYVEPISTRLTPHSSDQDVLIPNCRTKLFQFT